MLCAQLQSLRVQVIDRGQADGNLIRAPQDTQWVVIDAGRDRLQAEAMETEWSVDSVDLAITSHRHIDHYSGMDDVLEDFPVGLYLANLENCPNGLHDGTIRDVLEERGIPTQNPGADTLEVNGVRFIVLSQDPVDDEYPDAESDNSIIVRMEFGEFSMLFTGDAETDQCKWEMEHHPELLRADRSGARQLGYDQHRRRHGSVLKLLSHGPSRPSGDASSRSSFSARRIQLRSPRLGLKKLNRSRSCLQSSRSRDHAADFQCSG